MKTQDPLSDAKNSAARAAADLIKNNMLVGLGTGSTAAFFIHHLIQRVKEGLKIRAVATSTASLKQALEGNIPIEEINNITSIDITVDGADQIDPQKQMIKGAGGALLREKIIANMSQEMIVILDQTKLVPKLGGHQLPVEITPFAYKTTLLHLTRLGYPNQLRTQNDSPYITDNNNYITDITLPNDCNPHTTNIEIKQITGVVEHGLFLNKAGRIIIGIDKEKFEIRE